MSRFLPRLCACLRFKVPGETSSSKTGGGWKTEEFQAPENSETLQFFEEVLHLYTR